MDWTYVGNISCVTGESYCTSQSDLSATVQRGDSISIAGEAHTVRLIFPEEDTDPQ